MQEWMAHARAIVIVIGDSDGLIWEIEKVTELGHWDKTVLVFPPLDDNHLAPRWRTVRHRAEVAGARLEGLSDAVGSGVLTTVWQPESGATAYTARTRQEGAYEIALHAAAARLSLPATAQPRAHP